MNSFAEPRAHGEQGAVVRGRRRGDPSPDDAEAVRMPWLHTSLTDHDIRVHRDAGAGK